MIGDMDAAHALPVNFERKVGESSRIFRCVPCLGGLSPQNKNSRVFRPGHQSPQALTQAYPLPPQPAFCSGAAAAVFFSIARFSSSARGESSVALALSKNASKPPR